jgi:hypothetical protein
LYALAHRSEAHFLDRYSKAPQLPVLLILLLPLVFFLMLLPTRLADVIVQDLISAATGAIIIGYAYMEGVRPGLGIIIMAALLGLLAIVISYQIFRHRKTTRRATAPADRYIVTDQRTKATRIASKGSIGRPAPGSVVPPQKDFQPPPPPSDVADDQSASPMADLGASQESCAAPATQDKQEDSVDPRLLALPPSGEPTVESLHITSAAMLTGQPGDPTAERPPSDVRAPEANAEARASHLMSSRKSSSTGVEGKSRWSRIFVWYLWPMCPHCARTFPLSHLCLQCKGRPLVPP